MNNLKPFIIKTRVYSKWRLIWYWLIRDRYTSLEIKWYRNPKAGESMRDDVQNRLVPALLDFAHHMGNKDEWRCGRFAYDHLEGSWAPIKFILDLELNPYEIIQ